MLVRRMMLAGALVAAFAGAGAARADDSCTYAHDGYCDEAQFGGQGLCADGSDSSDCASGTKVPGGSTTVSGSDSCEYAHDEVCDEARYGGTGECTDGTDASDCKLAASGDNSCRYAWDGECDEPEMGTGECRVGTDTADCRSIYAGGDDSCQWANDGECDEHSGIGSGNCTDGTDVSDCGALYDRRLRDNSCATPLDGICNEEGLGDGTCDALTDTADCLGRDTTPGLQDYFFGHDDRVVIRPGSMPWSAMGQIDIGDDTACTGTLVSRRVVLTAAHCLFTEDNEPARPLRFHVGLDGDDELAAADVVDWLVAPDYLSASAAGDEGHDWAFLLLKRDLGTQFGTLGVHTLTEKDVQRIRAGTFPLVLHAGYPWDTVNRLIGHIGCRVVAVRDDNSILHQCDTTHGDSGSAIFIVDEGGFSIIAVDSQFDEDDTGQPTGLAVDSRAFAAALADYIALKDKPK